MINLFSKTHDSIKIDKFGNKKEGCNSGKKYFRWFAVSICPPEQVQTGPGLALAGPDMSKVRLFIKCRMFWV